MMTVYVLMTGREMGALACSLTHTHLFLNDVALAGCVERLLSLSLCGLSLFLLLLFSELLDSLQLLLDRSCLDGHYVPDLCRQTMCDEVYNFIYSSLNV